MEKPPEITEPTRLEIAKFLWLKVLIGIVVGYFVLFMLFHASVLYFGILFCLAIVGIICSKATEEELKLFSPKFFRLGFILTVVAALSWGTMMLAGEFFGGDGVFFTFLAIMVLVGVWYCGLMYTYRWKVLLLIVPILLFQCGGLIPVSFYLTRESSICSSCLSQLHSMGWALKAFHERNGKFPAAYEADQSGEPLFSWRVHLLQDVEEQKIFQEFNREEPWNSPGNIELTKERLPIYQCPFRRGFSRWRETPNHCSYVAVIGPETAWSGSVGRSLSEFTDGPENTILLVEIAAVDHPWAAPDYLTLDNFVDLIAQGSLYGPSSRLDPAYVNVLFADGTARYLPVDLPPETWRALFTISGGEKITLPEFDRFNLRNF